MVLIGEHGRAARAYRPAHVRAGGASRWNARLALHLIGVFGLVLVSRLCLLAPRLETRDSVGFGLALHDFDLAHDQPHFPGYPLLIVAARILRAVAPSDGHALAWVSAIASALVAVCVADLARSWAAQMRGEVRDGGSMVRDDHRSTGLGGAGFTAAALFAAAPLSFTVGAAPLSDAPGLIGPAAALALLARGRSGAAGLVLGLGLGLRPSAAPLALILAGAPRRGRAAACFALGVALWLVPLLVWIGPVRYAAIGHEFVAGHFGRWGGSAVTAEGALALRPVLLVRALAGGLGLAWPGEASLRLVPTAALLVVTGALGALQCERRSPASSRAVRLFLLAVVPYALWLLVAQNLERPRHALPLLVPISGGVAVGVVALWARARAWSLVLVVAILVPVAWSGARLASQQRSTPSPRLAMARHVLGIARARPGAVVTLFGVPASVRVVRAHAPGVDARAVPDLAAVSFELAGSWVASDLVLATHEVIGDQPPAGWRVVASFERSIWIDGPDATVTLFERDDEGRP